MSLIQIAILAIVQGAAELLPVSSSAHVIMAEKLMGLNPSSPEMTFVLVMLHTGTMFAVLLYFWPRWKRWLTSTDRVSYLAMIGLATACTGVLGFGLKKVIEHASHGEVEELFGSLPLISVALLSAGILIVAAGRRESPTDQAPGEKLHPISSTLIGSVQGLCLPFRGFSRSGATISTGLFCGISRELAEEFSFALAVVLTPPVILHELHRLMKATQGTEIVSYVLPGFLGMAFSFGAGLLALRWLSSWLENGRWKYFGYYCVLASAVVFLGYRFGL